MLEYLFALRVTKDDEVLFSLINGWTSVKTDKKNETPNKTSMLFVYSSSRPRPFRPTTRDHLTSSYFSKIDKIIRYIRLLRSWFKIERKGCAAPGNNMFPPNHTRTLPIINQIWNTSKYDSKRGVAIFGAKARHQNTRRWKGWDVNWLRVQR